MSKQNGNLFTTSESIHAVLIARGVLISNKWVEMKLQDCLRAKPLESAAQSSQSDHVKRGQPVENGHQ